VLATSDVIAFASTTDLARARTFYEAALGLPVVDENAYACAFTAHGTMLRITAVAEVAHPATPCSAGVLLASARPSPNLNPEASYSPATTAWHRTPKACGQVRTAIASPGSPTPMGTFCLSPSSTDGPPARTHLPHWGACGPAD
jgi:catechol 2,3-dioxygenase-like lactoylglutathione lyase family enzyme